MRGALCSCATCGRWQPIDATRATAAYGRCDASDRLTARRAGRDCADWCAPRFGAEPVPTARRLGPDDPNQSDLFIPTQPELF